MLDIPLLGDEPELPTTPGSRVADVAALFKDDPPVSRNRRPTAETRKESRRCPSCSEIVPRGMSLCGRCGLDLDTGQRVEIEEYLDETPMTVADPGPPVAVLMIGLLTLIVSLLLAGLSIFQLDGLGRLCLTPVCLFGAFAAIQFLQGRTLKLLIVALMLGGAVDIVALIALPIIQADETVDLTPAEVTDAEPAPAPTSKLEVEGGDDLRTAVKPIGKPLSERIDYTKIMLGVVVLLLDAVMLISLSMPGVNRYFDRRHRPVDETGYILP